MDNFNITVPAAAQEALSMSVDRYKSNPVSAQENGSLVAMIMKVLGLFAIVGTVLNLALEVAAAIQAGVMFS